MSSEKFGQTSTITKEDIEAAKELISNDATSTTDVATLREMLADQNGGSTTIATEDGKTIEVSKIGQEEFAELGIKATQAALDKAAIHSDSWRTDKK